MRTRIHFVTVGLVGLVGLGACGTRAATKLIEPRLHETGELLEREGRGRTFELGPYRVAGLEQSEQTFGGQGPLVPDDKGRTRPTQEVSLRFGLVGGPRPWRASCVGQRRQPADHDFAAIADELRDEVAMRCELRAEDPNQDSTERWVLTLDGRLAENLLGELVGPDADGDTGEPPRRVVELLMWHRLWNVSRRHLPASLVEVRSLDGSQTDAALIMATREQAVLDGGLEPDERALVVTAMLAIRLMPLGFDV